MITIREENIGDVAVREALLDEAFGIERFEKTCERLREGRVPARGLALIAELNGEVVGTVRLWHVKAGTVDDGLVLGPLAVSRACQSRGIGASLMRAALNRAALAGYAAVLLVGDAPYYARFGFSAGLADGLWLPGPVERDRFLALELQPNALSMAWGLVKATGELEDYRLASSIPVPEKSIREAA